MRSQLDRIRQLVNRYRVDRRLPPTVLDLITTTQRLRAAETRDRAAAAATPVIGRQGDGPVGRWRGRRLATVGPLPSSVDELALDTAARVESALAKADLEAFLVGRTGDRLEIGVPLATRRRVLDELVRSVADTGWCLQWFDRGSDGVVDLASAKRLRRVLVARSWVVFRAHQWGDLATGPETGVVITFWDLGTSGELELVGTRSIERFHPDTPDAVEVVAGRSFRGKAAFPVATSFERFDGPVDMVFAWVDGADPDWTEAFRRIADAEGRALDERALDPARYRSRDELRYALRSVWAYCGWARKIHVVTAGQRPDWLSDDAAAFGLHVVDHADILPADALPTFNSHAIEASFQHIDGLAEHFVYFNDDMLVARPIRPELFFTSNGLARVFPSAARVHAVENAATLAVDTAARRGRELLERRFGRVVSHKPLHAPYPLRRSTLCEIEREFAAEIDVTRRSRFRAPTDVSVAASFGQHYGLGIAASVLGEISAEYVNVESGRLRWHLDRIRLADDLDTYCINETQDGAGLPDRETRIDEFFRTILPVPAPWERDA